MVVDVGKFDHRAAFFSRYDVVVLDNDLADLHAAPPSARAMALRAASIPWYVVPLMVSSPRKASGLAKYPRSRLGGRGCGLLTALVLARASANKRGVFVCDCVQVGAEYVSSFPAFGRQARVCLHVGALFAW